MTELMTDITSATDRALHPEQHNEVNRRVIALEDSRGDPNGLATLDGGGKVPTGQLPAAALSLPAQEAADNAAHTLLDVPRGTVVVRTDLNRTFVRNANPWSFSVAADYILLPDATGSVPPVSSVNGETGAVVLDAADVGAQPSDADLAAIAALTPSNDDVIQRKGGAWTNRSIAQLVADLGVQPADADLTAIAALAPGNDAVIQRKGGVWTSRTMAQIAADLTAAGLGPAVEVPAQLYRGPVPLTGGATWAAQTISPAGFSWGPVAYGNGVFVALSDSGSTNQVSTSPDGFTWTGRTASVSTTWTDIVYANGLFVAVGTGGSASTSPDGITWTTRAMPSSATWSSVTYGNGVFVAVSASSSTAAATSPDGITWTARTLPAIGDWQQVGYGNGLFVAVKQQSAVTGDGRGGATSPDGITWTMRDITATTSTTWKALTYGAGTWVTINTTGTAAATSTDGITWTARTLPTGTWTAVVYGNGMFTAVGSNGAATTSPDGVTWTNRTVPGSQSSGGVAFGADRFVAVGTGNQLSTSEAGLASSGALANATAVTSILLTNTTAGAIVPDVRIDDVKVYGLSIPANTTVSLSSPQVMAAGSTLTASATATGLVLHAAGVRV